MVLSDAPYGEFPLDPPRLAEFTSIRADQPTEAPTRFMAVSTSGDPELRAIEWIRQILDTLDAKQVRRVLNYINDREADDS